MARARPGLAKAVNEILENHGADGKRLSFRQAERLTGLAPATISELAKGNARTPETVRRFAQGMNEEQARLMLLAGFVPDEEMAVVSTAGKAHSAPSTPRDRFDDIEIEAEEREWLGRLGRALAMLPPGRDRDLWKENLRRNAELIESFLEHMASERPIHG